MTAPRAYSYIRFSHTIQAGNDSIRRQIEASEKYAEAHGLELQTDFTLHDLGVSAFKGKNASEGALKSFTDAVEEGRIEKGSYLLVESLDRLSRQNAWTAFQQLSKIIDSGIIVVTVGDGQKYSPETAQSNIGGLFVALGEMIRANSESAMKSARIGASWKNKKQNAATKIVTAHCPGWLKVNSKRNGFDIIKDRVAIVKRIFDEGLNGKGGRVICSDLNRDGIPPFGRASKWQKNQVRQIQMSRAVLGEYQPMSHVDGVRVADGDPVIGYYPAVIDQDQFNLMQAALKGRAGKGGRKLSSNGELANIFAGIGKCGCCGGVMLRQMSNGGGKVYEYLRCINTQNGSGCSNKGLRYPTVESTFLAFTREIDLKSVVAGSAATNEAEDLRRQIEAHDAFIENAKIKTREYLIRIEQTPALEDAYTQRMVELAADIKSREAMKADDQESLDKLGKDGSSISDEEMGELIKTLQAGQGDRFKLASRIKSIVARIDMFGAGRPDDDAVPHLIAPGLDSQYIVVSFKDGIRRVVSMPEKVTANVKANATWIDVES